MTKTTLISFCTKSHADVWRLTSQGLTKFVTANRYIVFVPEDQVNFFIEITDPGIEVISEKKLPSEYFLKLQHQIAIADNSKRFNWYFQQFIKIESLIEIQSENLIIWDADCVPVRQMNFFEAGVVPKYIMSDEFHHEYFVNLLKILGLKKINPKSYISPGFPVPKKWVGNFISDLETFNGGIKWHDALISTIDFAQESGFSEFETLGTWIQKNHSKEILVFNCNWERFGQSKIGYAKNQTLPSLEMVALEKNIDIISFENWDARGFRSLLNKISKIIPNLIIKFQEKSNSKFSFTEP